MDKVKTFEAHTDYIRSIAVHPTLPCILSSSDDMLIKLWDWDKGWNCTQIFEGHSHYVMQVVFNPKDTNTFASASLDRTVKVWSLGQPVPNFTLEGHEKGVNTVDYFSGGDRPYLITGADDKLVKVWDYQTKSCIQTLEGHSHNVSAVCFHPELPIILTGSEDGTVRIWHSTTYRLENTLNYGMERVWAISYVKGSNTIALGYDEGVCMVKLGREEPVASMDSSGKIIWARHNEIQTVNVKSLGADAEIVDGDRLPLAVKDLGSCDLYPQTLMHNPNGRFVAVTGDGEYIIYTALAWRNKSFGQALDCVWSADSNEFACRESTSRVKIFKNFKEAKSIRPSFGAEQIYGGSLLAVRSADFICFYDWAEGSIIRRIDVPVKDVFWSDGGDLVCLTTDTSYYILKFQRDVVEAFVQSGAEIDEDGIEDAFDLVCEINERVRSGIWVGDCFVYNNMSWRLNYCVGGEVTTMFHLDRPMFLLGYMAAMNRLYLIDKEYSIVSYTLLLSMIEFKTLAMRGDMEAALEVLPTIPEDQVDNIARFLEARGEQQMALDIAKNPDYRFELAVQLGDLDIAKDIAEQADSESKWRQLGELALSEGRLELAEMCMGKAKDTSGLLLLHSARGDAEGVDALCAQATEAGKFNIAFLCLFLNGKLHECIDLLVTAGRIPEAAFFARTYLPSRMSEVVAMWRKDLHKVNPKAAESLADPAQYPNLFPDLELALRAEEHQAGKLSSPVPASRFPAMEGHNAENLIEQMQQLSMSGASAPAGSDADMSSSPVRSVGAADGSAASPVKMASDLEPQPGGLSEQDMSMSHGEAEAHEDVVQEQEEEEEEEQEEEEAEEEEEEEEEEEDDDDEEVDVDDDEDGDDEEALDDDWGLEEEKES
uniref:Coatomer subunit beta' n=1 Tax=Tetraselmis sp. GSL018 TaxID=582737 RepID=A0A061QYC6_9CHLO